MAEIAEWPEEVDLDRAKAALSRARERITNPGPDTDIARARRAWARAAARIELLTRELDIGSCFFISIIYDTTCVKNGLLY